MVLGADTQISSGTFSKHDESKIRMRVRNTAIRSFFAFADGQDILYPQIAVDELTQSIIAAEKGKLDIVAAVKEECRKICKLNPERDLHLLWVLQEKRKRVRLFQIHNDLVNPTDAAADGTGLHFINRLSREKSYSPYCKRGSVMGHLSLVLGKASFIRRRRRFSNSTSSGSGNLENLCIMPKLKKWKER